MNTRKIFLSRGFWLLAGAAIVGGVSVGLGASVGGLAWGLAASVGFLGVLLAVIYAGIRSALSSATVGVAGLRKVVFQQRREVMGRLSEFGSTLSDGETAVQARHRDLLGAIDISRASNVADFERACALISENSRSLGQRARTANSQLRAMEEIVTHLSATVDPANRGSVAADAHRTLRGMRSMERSMADAIDITNRIARTLNSDREVIAAMSKEIQAQQAILRELVLASDFRECRRDAGGLEILG